MKPSNKLRIVIRNIKIGVGIDSYDVEILQQWWYLGTDTSEGWKFKKGEWRDVPKESEE